jgi:hypothetical protein
MCEIWGYILFGDSHYGSKCYLEVLILTFNALRVALLHVVTPTLPRNGKNSYVQT